VATPRKHWFRVADSVLRDELTRDQRSTFVGLLAWFNQRRARDGHRGRRAQEGSIPPGDLLTITLTDSLELAREFLRDLQKLFELRIEERGVFTFVEWPNLAKFQEWGRPQRARLPGTPSPESRPPITRRHAPSGSGSGSVSEKKEEESASAWPRVLNVISKFPGERDEKLAWWRAKQHEIEAWAETKRRELPDAVRGWYSRYLEDHPVEKDRPFHDADAKARLQAAIEAEKAQPRASPDVPLFDTSKLYRRTPSAGGKIA
jgi:hypothetical protein